MNTHSRLPAAVLWDLDGTLIDSEPYWFGTETALMHAHGVEWHHDDALYCVGRNIISTAEYMISRGLPLDLDDAIAALNQGVRERLLERVSWQPDAYALLQRVRAAGIPCALVTASYQSLVDAVMVHAEGLFDVLVVGDDVTHGKPHPEPYLTAAERLGVPIEECIAIEDSLSGVGAALASGAWTIAVHRQVEFEPAERQTKVDTLDGITVADLRDLVAAGLEPAGAR